MSDPNTEYESIEDFDHNPEAALALGNMIVAWARAETTLVYLLARVSGMTINMSQAGYYRIPTFEAKIKFITALIGEWRPGSFDAETIQKHLDGLSRMSKARNHWVHGDWCATEDETETVVFNMRAHSDSIHRCTTVKAHDILDHAEAVLSRAASLEGLLDVASLPV